MNWQDEILDGEAKYRIKDGSGNVIYDNLTIEMITNVLTAGTPVNAVNMNKIEQQIYLTNNTFVNGSANDSYTITINGITSLNDLLGIPLKVKFTVANTGACTLNPTTLGAVAIKKNVSEDLSDNDIKANQVGIVVYDGTNFQMLSDIPVASWSQIATTTLGSDSASITFNSISTTYNRLRVVIEDLKVAQTYTTYLYLQFNDDSTADHYTQSLDTGSGHAETASTSIRVGNYGAARTDAAEGTYMDFEIINSSTKYKKLHGYAFSGGSSSTTPYLMHETVGGVWMNTANKITKMVFTLFGGDNFKTGTKITLYGMV